MKTIELTKGKAAIVDDKDFEWLSKLSWHAAKRKQTWYAATRIYDTNRGHIAYMHRLLTGAQKGEKVDHRDRNGLNNRRSNLRPCNSLQNCMNKGPLKNKRSRFKGVQFVNKLRKWCAEITVLGHRKRLGVFVRQRDAAIAYNEAALKEFGEFAYLNPVPL